MKYKVLKNRDYPGVTVGAVVVKAGQYFLSENCKYTELDYKTMIEEKRIEAVEEKSEKKEKPKKEEPKKDFFKKDSK